MYGKCKTNTSPSGKGITSDSTTRPVSNNLPKEFLSSGSCDVTDRFGRLLDSEETWWSTDFLNRLDGAAGLAMSHRKSTGLANKL